MTRDWVVVPAEALSKEALDGLAEAHVLREGTEYGSREFSLDEKTRHVRAQIASGEAVIVYSDEMGLTEIIPARELAKRRADAARDQGSDA